MKYLLVFAVLLATVANVQSGASVLLSQTPPSVENCCTGFDAADIALTVRILAHPALAGRGTGQAGFDVAGLILAQELAQSGFKPLPGSVDGYFQPFTIYNGTYDRPQSRNVIGYMPGEVANEYVVIGAHYDHLGVIDDTNDHNGSIANGIYLGADDNASGTAAVLAVAKALGKFVEEGNRLRRGVIVGFWGAEELGMLGSLHFIRSGVVPLDAIVATLNLDMVGRNDPKDLAVVGAETPLDFARASPLLEFFVREENGKLCEPFAVSYDDQETQYFIRSDGVSFFDARPAGSRIPVLNFTTLLHDDYHHQLDTVDKIDENKIRRIACFSFEVLKRTAQDPRRPRYIEAGLVP